MGPVVILACCDLAAGVIASVEIYNTQNYIKKVIEPLTEKDVRRGEQVIVNADNSEKTAKFLTASREGHHIVQSSKELEMEQIERNRIASNDFLRQFDR